MEQKVQAEIDRLKTGITEKQLVEDYEKYQSNKKREDQESQNRRNNSKKLSSMYQAQGVHFTGVINSSEASSPTKRNQNNNNISGETPDQLIQRLQDNNANYSENNDGNVYPEIPEEFLPFVTREMLPTGGQRLKFNHPQIKVDLAKYFPSRPTSQSMHQLE